MHFPNSLYKWNTQSVPAAHGTTHKKEEFIDGSTITSTTMFCECGTGSFKHVVDEGPDDLLGFAGGSPRGRRKHGHGANKVNPYAGRGLDRFSDVLSELEARRANILRRVVGSDADASAAAGLVLVRFVQSNGGWTPVIVKLPEAGPPPLLKGAAKKPRASATTMAAPPSLPLPPASPASSPREREGGVKKAATIINRVPARRSSLSWGRRMRRPSRYWPAVIVLTLVSLAVFGRVFAICLTSVWWYVLPTLGSGGCDDDDARRAGLGMSMEKKKQVSQLPHGKNGSSLGCA
ncbi:hypothetical protein HU200_018405 [Digitaria exilis]|uniref:Uncharacterized protein n=1 Tax=Digitaria exilis TaxID=1010633 RepID=A0A835KFH7_9POAL|nr:hypothetical protein HU200_018405 [Digitaria exilis]